MSIQLKWVLAFFSLIVLTLGMEAVALTHWMKRDLENQFVLRLRSQASLLATLVEQNLSVSGNLTQAAQLSLTQERFDPNMRIRVAGTSGNIVFDSSVTGEPHEALAPQSLAALSGVNETEWQSKGSLHIAKPLSQFGETIGIMDCSLPLSLSQPTLLLLKKTLLPTLLGASLVGVLLAYFVSRTLIKPIKELQEVTFQISKGEWDKRVSFESRDELGQLALAVHVMGEELKSQFRQLEEEKRTLESLFSSMIDGLIVLDTSKNVRFLNPEAERTLRIDSQSAFGKPLNSIWPLEEVLLLVEEGLRDRTITSREIALPYNVLKVYFVPVASTTGASGMLIFRDITEVRQLERIRHEFLGQVSHELRTPLTIIKGYAVTLEDDPILADAPGVKNILLRIEEEADRLTKLVEELLEYSQLKGGRSPLTFAPVQLKELVARTLAGLEPHFERYQIKLEFQSDKEVPQIMGDAARLKQVLLNLLDNATKYSRPDGKVEVLLSAQDKGALLTIRDNGTGIPKEDLPHIFERYFQGTKKDKAKGWGLGLPIVKEIVEAHSGHIEIESEQNLGTTVAIFFPSRGLALEKEN